MVDRDRGRSGFSLTSSKDPKLLYSRVFVGNLASDMMKNSDLEDMFKKYGKILACSIHNGFGFVQFENEADAKDAVGKEKGRNFLGKRIDVKLAAEGHRDAGSIKRGPPPRDLDRDRNDYDDYPPPPKRGLDRSPPPRDPYREPYRSRSPPTDRYDDPYRRGPPPERRGPPRGPPRDPYERDPYSRDPYGDPYRDPYGPSPRASYPPPPVEYPPPEATRPPFDCLILVCNNKIRGYAELIDRRLKSVSIITEIRILAEDKPVADVLDDITRRGVLYGIYITEQNEVHRSLTLNILHGTAQEHRNMPFEDAMELVTRNFDRYIATLRDKAPVPKAAPLYVPPSPDLAYLLNLMADGHQLTLEEMEKICNYSINRRDRLIEASGGIPPSKAVIVPAASPVQPAQTAAAMQQLVSARDENSIIKQQADLQSKILSILGTGNVSSNANNGLAAARNAGSGGGLAQIQQQYEQQQQQQQQQLPAVSQQRTSPVAAAKPGIKGGINFSSPSVQQALDNLISSGPNLLRNISQTSTPSSQNSVSQYAQAHHRSTLGGAAGAGFGKFGPY